MAENWRGIFDARVRRMRPLLLGLSAIVALSLVQGEAWAAKKLSSKDEQPRPIPLGVSGSSIEHIQFDGQLYCYSGTLGALVEDTNGDQYILSNNHVLAKENVPDLTAGDVSPTLESFVSGVDGHNVIQAALGDVKGPCTLGDTNDIVGTLSAYVPLNFGPDQTNAADNTVDAAIAAVTPGMVDPDGRIFDIGTVSDLHLTVDHTSVGLNVQKTGRTTGHTFGTIEAIEVVVDVEYGSGFGRFYNQVRIRGLCDELFSDSGDSGSLIVNVPQGGDRQAVGLLFAGGGLDTIANPIGDVLTELGVSMMTCTGNCDHAGVTDEAPTCGGGGGGPGGGGPGGGPGGGGGGGGGRPFAEVDPVGLAVAASVKSAHSDVLIGLPGVVGHGLSVDENGEPVIEVYVKAAGRGAVGAPVPSEIDGISVRVVETGPIHAY
jgi:hypothetical protein